MGTIGHRDLLLLTKAIRNKELPEEYEWLRRYFKKENHQLVLSFYIHMKDYKNQYKTFKEHTGVNVSSYSEIVFKIKNLISMLEEAKKNRDMAKIASVKLGRYYDNIWD